MKTSSLLTRLTVRSSLEERRRLDPACRGARGSVSRQATSADRSHACADSLASAAPYQEAL